MAWLYEAQRVLTPAVRWFFRIEAFDAGRIPREGGALLCPNHASFLDPWFVGNALTARSWRNVITDDWFDRNRLWRAFFRSWGTIPTSTRRPQETLDRVARSLAEGEAVVLFPEGHVSRDGTLARGRRGVALIAAATGAPVYPCGIRGGFDALPRHRRIPRRGPVRVHVGEPVRFPGAPLSEPPSKHAAEAFADDLMTRIADLAGLAPPRR